METLDYKKLFILGLILITSYYFAKTIFEGIRAWLGSPRKRQHIQYGGVLGILLITAIVVIEVFVRTSEHHQPRGLLFHVHLVLDIIVLVTYIILRKRWITPRLHGAWHYLIGILFALAFVGSAITGAILLHKF